MKTHFLLAILFLVVVSCKKSDDENSNESFITLNVKNVYIENPQVPTGTDCTNDGTTISCWRDLIITDGTYKQSPTDNIFYPNEDVTYRINFLDLQLLGDLSTPVTLEQHFNSETGNYSNQGMEGIIFYTSIVVENGNILSSDDLTETQGYVRFTVISENNFSFEIELLNGTIYRGNYSGQINILDQEYSFAPFD